MKSSSEMPVVDSLLAGSVIVFFGLNVDTVLGHLRYRPVIFQLMALFALIAVAIWVGVGRFSRKQAYLLVSWMFIYLGVSVVGWTLSADPESRSQGSEYAVVTATIVLAATIGFTRTDARMSRLLSYAIALTLTAACVSILADPFVDFRGRISADPAAPHDLSRAAGVFLQPNIAALAVPVLLATAIPRVGSNVALVLAPLSFAATLLTFSRAGFFLLALVASFGVVSGYLPRTKSLLVLGAIALLFVAFDGAEIVRQKFGVDQGSGSARLSRTQDFVGREAFLNDVRIEVAYDAWIDGLREPWIGHGLGYSWYWADIHGSRIGPHNLYMRHLLESGIIGLVLWPLLALLLYFGRTPDLRISWTVGLLAVVLFSGFVSHNLTEHGVFLVPVIGAFCLPTMDSAENIARSRVDVTRALDKLPRVVRPTMGYARRG